MKLPLPGHPSDRGLHEVDWLIRATDAERAAAWWETKERMHSAIMRARFDARADAASGTLGDHLYTARVP